jgi:probable LLM family oxidoreductase
MEIGIYSFGDVQRDPATGNLGSSAQAMRNLLEAIRVADDVGLDFFGVGEHHTREMPASSPGTIIAAAAAATRNIRLGSAVSVLTTDDPVRVFQQFAIADAISGGRVEIIAGRGSSVESFPLFGESLQDYDALYAEKLELLLKINAEERVTWSGSFRAPLQDALVVPRPDAGSLPIWLATGGNGESSVRAARLGLPISYAIIGGESARFAPLARLYRQTAEQPGVPVGTQRISVASPGFIAEDDRTAKDTWWPHWRELHSTIGAQRGWPAQPRSAYDAVTSFGGALYVGGPEEIAERMVDLHGHLGHMRHFLQMDIGQLPHRDFLRSIELLGTEVKPLVVQALGTQLGS